MDRSCGDESDDFGAEEHPSDADLPFVIAALIRSSAFSAQNDSVTLSYLASGTM